jgi:hypothetical protein
MRMEGGRVNKRCRAGVEKKESGGEVRIREAE